MQSSSSANVRDASILLGRYICQRKSYRLSRSLGLLQSGVSTWSAPCRERRVVTHLFIAIDKFTKWIEAKPVTTITAAKAKEFFQDIVVRFGVSNRIIMDNGTQFTGVEFKDWCEELSIKICYTSVAHPQSNGQVEHANGMVLQDVKSRVFDRLKPYAGKWARELSSVLWDLRTSPSRATSESPFFLTYGSEAVLPNELKFGSPRVHNFNEKKSKDSR